MGEEMLSLCWNNHDSTFCHMLSSLRAVERYTDVTLACEGKFYPVHKLILSTCSDYFSEMFESTPCKHPIIVLTDIHCKDIEALLSYMYAGIVSVPQSNLDHLIKVAELLQIKGLAVPDELPTSNIKVRSLASSSNTPRPKRLKRQEPDQEELSSPPSTCIGDDKQEQQMATSKKPQKAGHKPLQKGANTVDDRKSGQVDKTQADENVENEASALDCPLSQVETLFEEFLIKEEFLDEESNTEVPDTHLNYGTLISEGSVDSNEAEVNQSSFRSARYNEQYHDQSLFQHHFLQLENSSEVQSGPALLQLWQSLSEVGECSSGQGYISDMNKDTTLPIQLESQSLYPMVSQITREGGSAGAMKIEPTFHKLHQNPYIYYSDFETDILQSSYFLRKRNQNQFSCSQCPYATTSKSNLMIHLRTHTGERPYSCPECSFTASFEYNLKVHMRTHTGEKPFECPNCPLKFAQKAHLKNHSFTHTGERPFSCQSCSASFSRRSNLRRHSRTHE